jgi:hypothetical protein
MILSTSLTAVVLSSLAMAAPSTPNWQTDYSKAMAQAVAANKPVAVFIAHGEAGFAQVIAEGKLTQQDSELLTSKFVCVYVDAASMQGQELAQAFQMKQGLVISGKAGNKQALRHEGSVKQSDLSQYLVKFSDTNRNVTTTEVGGVVARPVVGSYFGAPAGGCPNGRCPNVRY